MNKTSYKEVNKNIFFRCSYHGRYNQTERAILVINDNEKASGSYHWVNRPWQSFDFDIAMNKAFQNTKNLSPYYKRLIKKWLKNGGKREEKRVNKELGMIGVIAKMGDIFCDTQKSKNDWKARMLKAGLSNQGLVMPNNWDSLSEEEKENRLDKVINNL